MNMSDPSSIPNPSTMLMNEYHFAIGLISTILSAMIFSLNLLLVYLFLKVQTFRKYSCYHILAQLGISQCIQLAAHFITGIFTMAGYFPDLAQKIIGGAINAIWMTMIALVLTLSINRLLMSSLIFPCFEKRSRSAIFVLVSYISWLIGSGLFSIYMTPNTAIVYDFTGFYWSFGSGIWTIAMIKVTNDLSHALLLISLIVYLLAGALLAYRKFISKEKIPRAASPELQRKHLEKRIFIQASINFLLLGIFILLYYQYVGTLAQFKWFEFSVNLIWILYLVINPILCLVIIKPVRNELIKLFYSKDVKDLQVYYVSDQTQRTAIFLTMIKHRNNSIIPDSVFSK